MKMHTLFLFLTTFLAAGVEVVEMVTIVLGVGVTRGWPGTFAGAAVGLLTLSAVVAIFGHALTYIPLSVLRAIVGILLLLFGLQWLRKGIWRLGQYGVKAYTKIEDDDEETDFQTSRGRLDWTAFVLAFKGVLLEGLEVAFIVVTFGAATQHIQLAVLSAVSAFIIVIAIAAMIQKALRNIPGHVIKFSVGLLLVTFGTFWSAEGLGVEWPGEDLSILGLLGVYILFAFIWLPFLRRSQNSRLHKQEGHSLMSGQPG
ncbi:MAG: hypothetical protein ACXU9W_15625 [Thermodesulfobacteriota bacterium]